MPKAKRTALILKSAFKSSSTSQSIGSHTNDTDCADSAELTPTEPKSVPSNTSESTKPTVVVENPQVMEATGPSSVQSSNDDTNEKVDKVLEAQDDQEQIDQN